MIGIIIGFVLLTIASILIVTFDASTDLEAFEYTSNKLLLIIAVIGLSITAFMIGTTSRIEELTYKKCLDGQNPYEKVIYYDTRDSVPTAVDSVYILKQTK